MLWTVSQYVPDPSPVRNVFSLGWLMSLGFGRSSARAVCAYPMSVLTVLVYLIRGHVYETADGDGMVIFGRYRLWLDSLIVGVAFAPLALLYVWLISVTDALSAGLVWAAFMGLIFGGVAAMGQSSVGFPTGPETPDGERWQIAGLAQRPGTRLSALQLGRALVEATPSGAVVVAAAADDRLVAAYQRFGFKRGRNRRVYKVIDRP